MAIYSNILRGFPKQVSLYAIILKFTQPNHTFYLTQTINQLFQKPYSSFFAVDCCESKIKLGKDTAQQNVFSHMYGVI